MWGAAAFPAAAGVQEDFEAPPPAAIPAAQAGKFVPSKLRHLTAEDLRVLVERRRKKEIDFRLVDLRLEADFAKGSIEGSENMPLKKLRFMAEPSIAHTEKVVLYGYSAAHPAGQNAAIFLINKGFQCVWMLDGGYESWRTIELRGS